MPNYTNWLASNAYATPSAKERTRRIIEANPTDIVIMRDGESDLDEQTVRIEYNSNAKYVEGDVSLVAQYEVSILGFKSDTTYGTTDIQNFDRFNYNDTLYEVKKCYLDLEGHIIAYADQYDFRRE